MGYDKKEVFIDTNFFLLPFQFNVDIIEEFKIRLPNHKLVTTEFVIRELKGLKNNKNSKTRLAASLGLKIANSNEIEIRNIPLKNGESVDDALVRVSDILATNDIELRKKAKKNNLTIVYLRQKRYLAIDGNSY
ncbi:MAG: twitching motility protein PilT [archaeon]|nr:twitching motility protein PilT [archaeon]